MLAISGSLHLLLGIAMAAAPACAAAAPGDTVTAGFTL